MSILGVIPARAGSKGIINKNLNDFLGKPLISYTIDSARKSKLMDDVLITSDSDDILNFAFSEGIKKLRKRSDQLSSDQAPMVDTIIDAVEFYEKEYKKSVSYIFLLQPTSPLRTEKHIDDAIMYLKENNYKSIVGVSPMHEHPTECILSESGGWHFLADQGGAVRRQDYKGSYFFISGAVYLCSKEFLFTNRKFVTESETKLFEMEKESGVDIDEMYDFFRARAGFDYANYLKEKI